PGQPRRQPRGPRQHQGAQMMPVPGREQPYPEAGRPAGPRPTRAMPTQPPPPEPGPPEQGLPPEPPRRRKRRFGVGKILLSLLVLFVVFVVGVWIYLDTSIKRIDAFANLSNRPAAAAGTNWLIVGSDSRDGLTPEQE